VLENRVQGGLQISLVKSGSYGAILHERLNNFQLNDENTCMCTHVHTHTFFLLDSKFQDLNYSNETRIICDLVRDIILLGMGEATRGVAAYKCYMHHAKLLKLQEICI
jgi:hypothetical protein